MTASDFDAAWDRIILGRREGSNVLHPEKKHTAAVHEAGHALVASLSEHADPVAKETAATSTPSARPGPAGGPGDQIGTARPSRAALLAAGRA